MGIVGGKMLAPPSAELVEISPVENKEYNRESSLIENIVGLCRSLL